MIRNKISDSVFLVFFLEVLSRGSCSQFIYTNSEEKAPEATLLEVSKRAIIALIHLICNSLMESTLTQLSRNVQQLPMSHATFLPYFWNNTMPWFCPKLNNVMFILIQNAMLLHHVQPALSTDLGLAFQVVKLVFLMQMAADEVGSGEWVS